MEKLNKESFSNKAKKIHGGKYDYSLVDYIMTHEKVKIICFEHDEFYQSPANHLRGNGCPKCKGLKKLTTKEFINNAEQVHGDKFDYSLAEYKNSSTKVKIICAKHGVFNQRASHHLSGSGCPKCVGKNKTNDSFIDEVKKIHGDMYDYSLVNYISDKSKIRIICPIHGEFSQMAGKHLSSQGCPVCKESKGERDIRGFLTKNNINYIRQKRFSDCRDKKPLPFDFYLPDYNTCIEFQGRQHYEPISHWGGVSELEKTLKRDKIKMEYCKINNIPLLKIKYNDNIHNKLTLGADTLQTFL